MNLSLSSGASKSITARPAGRPLMTLPDQIAEHIFTAIANGEYVPGDRIREEAVAEQLQVSRGPVREALRILEKDSVVCILPNRGAHVTQLSIKEVGDIFEIRARLTGAMIDRLNAEEAARLAAAIDAQVSSMESIAQDPERALEYFELTFSASRIMREACGNEHLSAILRTLSRQTLRYTHLGLATPTRRKESARNWRAMQMALKAGELDGAVKAAVKLIEDSRREAVRQLEAQAAERAGARS